MNTFLKIKCLIGICVLIDIVKAKNAVSLNFFFGHSIFQCNIFLYFQVYHTAYGFQCKGTCKKATKPEEAPKVSGNYPYYCTIDENSESTLGNKSF